AVVMTNDEIIQAENINLSSSDMITEMIGEEMTLRQFDLRIIKNYLNKYDNNMKLVAEKLDIGLSTIYRMLKEESED
ncbi:MAG: sigma-54-dependent Fis family transcriptional regulator, partial [Bacteroidetes bacterium]|nr:sigma-54-dependent Fis family transcriptional regulator [Bacteroidota bacterium]